jgi:class 3 adenylate cyclase
MTGTRRLAAILAIDVVGYPRLMGEDEAGTARLTHMPTRWTRRRPN